MLPILDTKQDKQTQLKNSVVSTLAFFALYDLPLSSKRLHELLLESNFELGEVENTLEILANENKIFKAGTLYSLYAWKADDYRVRQIEISKKWSKIDRYFKWLAIVPFVRNISVINSLSMGTADAESDIDFFVITEKRRLYFVRSVIIILFKLLGIYKNRKNIRDRFCFGFFVTKDNLNLEHLLIKPQDPYLLFWLANMRPLIGGQQYWQLMSENNWLLTHFPNFKPANRLASVKQLNYFLRFIKLSLEVLLWLPSLLFEPIIRRIHINHTFKLAENHSASSTTVANAKMLKLHAADVRAKIARDFAALLARLK